MKCLVRFEISLLELSNLCSFQTYIIMKSYRFWVRSSGIEANLNVAL
jgi:hypothetical protein